MFPQFTTAVYLSGIPNRYGDVKSAVATIDGRFMVGQSWSFWMEDDPRAENGILPLAKYECCEPGRDDSKWRLVE